MWRVETGDWWRAGDRGGGDTHSLGRPPSCRHHPAHSWNGTLLSPCPRLGQHHFDQQFKQSFWGRCSLGDLSLMIPVVQLELGTTEPSSGVDPVFCREIFPNILRRLSDHLNSCINRTIFRRLVTFCPNRCSPIRYYYHLSTWNPPLDFSIKRI